MKLWHDDIRKPPAGWVWARTNDLAKEALATGAVTEISLDHDLGLEHLDPDSSVETICFAGPSQNGNGLDLVKWMIETGHVPEMVTIHSWNPDGTRRMAQALNDAGHNVLVAAFELPATR